MLDEEGVGGAAAPYGHAKNQTRCSQAHRLTRGEGGGKQVLPCLTAAPGNEDDEA
jgi:hypothetical protein